MDIEKIKLFKGLTRQDLEEYSRFLDVREFKKGDTLFQEGDSPGHLLFVLEGELKVFKEYASGKSAILGIFGQGESIAEVAVIDGKSYPASCQAATNGKAAFMKRDDAVRILTSNPKIAFRIMTGLSDKLRTLTSDLGSMSVQSVIRRLSRFLLKMADKMGVEGGEGISVELFLTRKDMAECIGTSFEVAVRALGKLQNDSILEIDGKHVLIKDSEGLKKLAGELDE
jgi:CRP/FNR family transcriptional regulator